MWSTLLTLAAAGALCPVAAQSTSYDRLDAARAQMRAMKLDSAVVLLRAALDTASHPTRDDQVQAWLLLGVISFYKGDDSGTSGDFRRALALDPVLRPDGLERYDSALVVLFDAQRAAAAMDSGSPGTPTDAVVDCARTCPEDVALPRPLAFPTLEGLGPDRFDVQHERHGVMTVQFIVDTAGWVAPASLSVVASNLQMKTLEQALVGALAKAQFTPAHAAKGRRVSVVVQGKMGFRLGRFEAEIPLRPRRRPT